MTQNIFGRKEQQERGYMKALPPHGKSYRNIYSIMGFLFMKASRKAEDVFVGMQKKKVKPGQCVTCKREISEYTGLTFTQVRKGLNRLEEFGEIDIEATNKCSLITLTDFEITREC